MHAVSKYTENGADSEAKACFVEAVPTRSAAISASENVAFASMTIEDGQAIILFNPVRFGSNMTHIGDDLARVIDVGEQQHTSSSCIALWLTGRRLSSWCSEDE